METKKAKKGVNWKLAPELIRAVKRHAADHDIYPSNVAERALAEFLDRHAARRKVAATTPAR